MSWCETEFSAIVREGAFGPRFSSASYSESGNIATLRTTDLSPDGTISYGTMPLASLDEAKFANHFLEKGDIVISRSGRIGTTAHFDGYSIPVLPGAFLLYFRLTKDANSRFYTYWFNSPRGQQRILSIARGAAQQNINLTNAMKLRVPRPPVAVQRRIVELLLAYDDLLENNRRRIQLLEQAARLLFKEWFVHLRFPGHEHIKIINGVPEGWERRTLGEVAPLNYGKGLTQENRIPGPYPVYGSSGIVGYHEKPLVAGPTIIVGRKGNVGSVYWSSSDCFPIDTAYYIRSELCSPYLYYSLSHMHFISTDVAVPGLNRDFAHSRHLLVPEGKFVTLFHQQVQSIHSQLAAIPGECEKPVNPWVC